MGSRRSYTFHQYHRCTRRSKMLHRIWWRSSLAVDVLRISIVEAFEKYSFAPFRAGTLSSGSVSFTRDYSESFWHDKRQGVRSGSKCAYNGFAHFASGLWPDNRHGPHVVPEETTVDDIFKACHITSNSSHFNYFLSTTSVIDRLVLWTIGKQFAHHQVADMAHLDLIALHWQKLA
jgi:hypothetical protein